MTVEHVLSAVSGLGIDNINLKVSPVNHPFVTAAPSPLSMPYWLWDWFSKPAETIYRAFERADLAV